MMGSGQSSVDYVLYQLDQMFKVLSLAKPLVTATTVEQAQAKHTQYGYDRIPIEGADGVNTYYDAINGSIQRIEPREILSSSAGILRTLACLDINDFYFVLEERRITHFIHYSDLNNPLLLIAIYSQIAYFETVVRNFLRYRVSQRTSPAQPTESDNESFLAGLVQNLSLGTIDIPSAKGRYEQKKRDNFQTDIFDELRFVDELSICNCLNLTSVINSETRLNEFVRMRNSIMHGRSEIIRQKADIDKWLKFLTEFQWIIGRIKREHR